MKRQWMIPVLLMGSVGFGIQARAGGKPDCDAFPSYIVPYAQYPSSGPYFAPATGEPQLADSPDDGTPAGADPQSSGAPAPTPDSAFTPSLSPGAADLAASMPMTGSFGSFGSGLVMGSSSAFDTVGAYIDDALIRTRVRTRFDSVDGGNSDRAEFLYATYNEVATGIGVGGLVNGPSLIIPNRLDYEEISTYLELALSERFSIFTEIGYRWNDVDPIAASPGADLTASGFGDMHAGFKYALRETASDILTFQFRVLIPTGNATELLGTGHASLMPGLLYREQVTDRLTFFSEIHDWIGVGTTELVDGRRMGGNVLRYGLGFGYDIMQRTDCCGCTSRLTWVNEVVGWTVLDGLRFTPLENGVFEPADAQGDTIVNFKTGPRYSTRNNSLYVGYGFAMTDKVWYDDIIRVQWERFF